MDFQDVCKSENLAWKFDFGEAFYYVDETGSEKTVFRFQIPFSQDDEALFLSRYQMPAPDRMRFYQNLVRCIQRQVSISKHLNHLGVSSILSYSRVEQDRNEDNVTSIYLETEKVVPITSYLLKDRCTYITMLDVISRLALILRDISKPPANVVHRGLNLSEVYISSSNRILLGGFYYADCKELGAYPDFLPCIPPHLSESVKRGESGAHKTDIQALSFMAWNLFSGIPYNANWSTKRIPTPEYAKPELVDALLYGMAGEDEVCNLFRRKLNEHRKQLLRGNEESQLISIRKPLLKKIELSWVSSAYKNADNNTNPEKEESSNEC